MTTAEMIFESITILLTLGGGLYVYITGKREYKNAKQLKRAEFLDKLIDEFLRPETEVARNMLDDYVYVKKENREKSPEEQKATATSLEKYLRNHTDTADPVGTPDEVTVRKSFDKLFDFFTKLSYYLKQDLVSPSELTYFKYYLDKVQSKPEVLAYINRYFYLSDFHLLFNAIR